jgi:hypothetical protein
MGQVFRLSEKYLEQFDPEYVGQFVEIGTSRQGDDGSTATIAGWASRFNRCLWTVDMDPKNCEFAKVLNLPNLEVVNSTGEAYADSFPSHITYISFLYLDNFDWDWHPEKTEHFVLEQQVRYRELGFEMNNVNSQRAHLAQMSKLITAMGEKSLVVCDDTWYNKWIGHYSGKSGSVVPFLLNHGYRVLYTEEHPTYGTILGRGIE